MDFNVVIPMWLSTGVVVLLFASVMYHCLHFISKRFYSSNVLTNYIKTYHDVPEQRGVPRLLRILHYYHAFRYEYDIKSDNDIDTVVDRVHDRIRRHSTNTGTFLYEIQRVNSTYKEL